LTWTAIPDNIRGALNGFCLNYPAIAERGIPGTLRPHTSD